MANITFLHAADIHLDSPLRGLETYEDAPVEEIRGATRKAFANLIQLALEEEVNFLLICGDLFDGEWNDYNSGLFFANQMSKLGLAGIKVFIVLGNHDAASRIAQKMPLPENVTLFGHKKPQSVVLEESGIVLHGQSYGARAVNDNLAAAFPRKWPGYVNIGLLHTSLTGRDGHASYAPCTREDLLATGYEYWALGHVHSPEVVSPEPPIIFPGNLQGRHIRESGAKGVVLATIEDGRIRTLEWRYLDVLRWALRDVDLSGCEAREEVFERVRSAMLDEQEGADGRVLALRLSLQGATALHGDLHSRTGSWHEDITSIAAGLDRIWLEQVIVRTRPPKSLADLLAEESPFAGLLRSINTMEVNEKDIFTALPDLIKLRNKIPAELADSDAMFFGDGKRQKELQDDVRELLLARLLQHGGEQ